MQSKSEILDAIEHDDGSCNSWGEALDWLSEATGCGDLPDSYTIESIIAAVRAEDPDLLERC